LQGREWAVSGESSGYYCLIIKNTWQKLSRHYNRSLASFGLSVPQALLLLELSPTIGINPRTLSENLNLDSSSTTGLLGRMENTGLLERRADPGDRRGVKVFLTPKGARLQQSIYQLVGELEERLSKKISPEEAAVFRRVMGTIARELSHD